MMVPYKNLLSQPCAVHKALTMTTHDLKHYSHTLKLPPAIILRIHELIVYSCLDREGPKREEIESIYRISLKRRYFLNQLKEYQHLFKGIKSYD